MGNVERLSEMTARLRHLEDRIERLHKLLREIRSWMDEEMGEWDAKFIAEIDEVLE